MTGPATGLPGQLANESLADYKQRFQAQLAFIEAEEQRQLAAEAARLQAEAATTAEKLRLQAKADADAQARRKEAQDLLQRHEANSIERLKFWHFEPNGNDTTPEEQHKEFLSKLVTRLLYAGNYQQSELERQNQELQQQYQDLKTQHQELANLHRIAVPGPDAGASSSAPSSRQLEERVDHVVAMLGDISNFAAPTTISSQLETLKTKVQQLQSTNSDGNPMLSCAALSQTLGDREQYTTFAEIIDKARKIIKTNRAAAHDKSTWQPTYVEKVRTGPRQQQFAAVQSDSGEDPAATPGSREGDQVAAVQPRSNKPRVNGKAKPASPAGNGQPAPPWVKFGLTEAEYKYRNRYGCCYWCNSTKHKTSICQDQPKEDVRPRPHGVVPDLPIRHEIILEDRAVPPRGCIYQMSEEELSVLRAQLDDLLEKGWIRPSSSPYGAPVLFVRKKNKDLRLCIDYRKLNAQTIRNASPLPRIDDLLERLGGAQFFSKLDLKSGYHQLEIRKEDRYKTAFKTRYGHFEWLVMPFGLTNAPTTFQAAMTTEFRHMLDRYILIYLDDILTKYKANRDKCEFARQELEYLGHYVTPQGIRLLADKIEDLRVWPEPTNTTDVRSFMKFAGYYQRFITGYSRTAAPMTKLQSPKVPFVFDDDARRSFQALNTAMLMAPVLSIYDPTLPTRVTTDASGYGIRAVLEQHDGEDWHPVEYFSHKVPPINSLDDARKKELLAFVMALKRWRHFLLGRRRFTWVTENNPLTYYKTQDTVSSTIGRWMYFIDQFDFTLKHLPDLSNRAADALSRRPDLCARTHHAFAFDEELQQHFIRTSPRCMHSYLRITRRPATIALPTGTCSSTREARTYYVSHATAVFELASSTSIMIHDSPAIYESTALLHGFDSDSDGLISLPMSLGIATLAKFADAASPATAIPTAKDIVRDRDTRFMSAFWTALMQESGTKMKPSSARHPQTDGQTERAHQTAQMMLRTLVRPNQKDWVDRLPDIEFAYNTSVHPTIGVTPFELHHGGRKSRIFADLLLPRPADIDAACSPASVRKYRELLTQARANMQKAQVCMQQQANRRRMPCPIRAGDLVWVSAEEFALEQDVSRKLLPKWFGPWSVTAAAGDEPDGPSFVINIPEHLTVHPVFHASKLATYTPAKSDDFPGRRSQDPPMDGL
ncbi:hypothetical protein CBR_g48867 [Chara braunii]|uniref:Integrase catalytic domain-containing protein n=1 Tax=Chara braunii TaxID=69332 RepID=A0A388M3J6_CHABU|nr:hypothetical protein CBR_g48867 [Chara braunii]|eukprot:GBG89160.1 hypothetical protein CBR_g48867 [Chara braunii]